MNKSLNLAENIESEIGYIQVNWQGVVTGKFAMDTSWSPAIDLYRAEQNFYAIVDLAGVCAENIALEIHPGKLKIAGTREPSSQLGIAERVRCEHLEINQGRFSREFRFPETIDAQNASARYQNGFLIVNLPRICNPGK